MSVTVSSIAQIKCHFCDYPSIKDFEPTQQGWVNKFPIVLTAVADNVLACNRCAKVWDIMREVYVCKAQCCKDRSGGDR